MSTPNILPSGRRSGSAGLSTTLNDGWRKFGGSGIAVYASGTTFTLTGDYTTTFTRGRKVRVYHASTGAFKYATIVSSSYGAPTTTVTISGNTFLNETYSSIWINLSPVGYAGELPSGTSFSAGDIVYAGTDTMLTRLAKPAAPGVLVNDPTGIPQWAVTGWLPLNATLTYSSADDPTIVLTSSVDCSTWLSVGNKMKWVNGGNTIYAIVQVISGTTITCLQEIAPTSASAGGGTAARVATANSAITLPFFSYHATPYGFPTDKRKWTMQFVDSANRQQATPVNGTWYNIGSSLLSVPIGAWFLGYKLNMYFTKAAATDVNMAVTLSTSASSESDENFTHYAQISGAVATISGYIPASKEKYISLSSKTPYYLIAKSTLSAGSINYDAANTGDTMIVATCAHL